jgi:valyl-tRNA synthetase
VLRDLIASVRNVRAELKVETKLKVPIEIHAEQSARKLFELNWPSIQRLANVEGYTFVDQPLKGAGTRSSTRFDVRVIYEKQVDKAAERERLSKELAKLETQLANAQRQLGNEAFLAKAPPKVVEGLVKNKGDLDVLIRKTRAALDALK